MHDWILLISNAAGDVSPERGANARSASEILSDAIQAITDDSELAAFLAAARMIVAEGSGRLSEDVEALTMRHVANAVLMLQARALSGPKSAAQQILLEEVCWGRFNQLWEAQAANPRVPFAPRDKTALYLRAILREFGSPISATETAGGSSIFGADPMAMLDLLERDGNVSRFLSVLLAYANQGWLHPADIALRFERWHSALLRVATSDIGYRTALSVVGQADDIRIVSEKLVLLLVNVVARLLEETERSVGVLAGVYDARPSAEVLKRLAAVRFGSNALTRALEDRNREAGALARTQESSVVRYLEHLAYDAQELSDQWRSEEDSRGEITNLLCEVLHTKARPKPMELHGATQAQLIRFYG